MIEQRLTYRIAEVARLTGAKPTTVHTWLDKGYLAYVQTEPGGVRMIPAADLQAFLLRYRKGGHLAQRRNAAAASPYSPVPINLGRRSRAQ